MQGSTTPLYTGDITAYTRYVVMTYLILFALIASMAGFTFSKSTGLMVILFMLAIVIFALWKLVPGKKVIEFYEENIIICSKGAIKTNIGYDAVKKFECVNTPKWRAHFTITAGKKSFDFCEQEGDKWRETADKLMALLHSKNCSITLEDKDFYKKWEELDK